MDDDVCVVRGPCEIDWDVITPLPLLPSPVSSSSGSKVEIWLSHNTAPTGQAYQAVMSDGTVISGLVPCATVCRGELLVVEQVLLACGYNVVLHTSSTYVCNVFNRWIDRWLLNGYKTYKGGNVYNRDIIHRMVLSGCTLVEYSLQPSRGT
jgi:hypothetical protein